MSWTAGMPCGPCLRGPLSCQPVGSLTRTHPISPISPISPMLAPSLKEQPQAAAPTLCMPEGVPVEQQRCHNDAVWFPCGSNFDRPGLHTNHRLRTFRRSLRIGSVPGRIHGRRVRLSCEIKQPSDPPSVLTTLVPPNKRQLADAIRQSPVARMQVLDTLVIHPSGLGRRYSSRRIVTLGDWPSLIIGPLSDGESRTPFNKPRDARSLVDFM